MDVINKRYDNYKNSGIEWFGEIPEHWEIRRIKELLLPQKNALKTGPFGSDLKFEDFKKEGFKIYNQRNVIDDDFDSGNYYIDNVKFEQLATCEIFPSDILITTRGTIGRASIFPKNKLRGVLHPCLIRMQINQNIYSLDLMKRTINDSPFFLDQLLYLSNATTIEVIYSNFLKEVKLISPPLTEQIAIASYLDNKTTKIDQLIANKQKQIDLLKEMRQIEINTAVTKGLDPNVKMKDSGIEWLGEVPEHWEVKRFRYCFTLNKGLNITKSDLLDEGVPCVSYGEIHSKYGFEIDPSIHDLKCVQAELLESKKNSILKKGDVVFADTSEDVEGAGNFTYTNTDDLIVAGYHTIIAKPTIEINFRFLAYSLDSISYRNQIKSKLYGVKVYSITNRILKETSIWLPSKKEQIAIQTYLDNKTKAIDILISNLKSQINQLQEIRKIEIYNAVTGKIKVA